ncbi:MAG: hypothetical protein IJ746_00405 [Ruminococcus sp.]|nr:hypothetical protein [Ruminococcus sp.]
MFGKRSELSGLELVMYESKGIYLETHAYSLAWLFCGAALACMAVPILKNYKEAHGTAAGPAAVPPVYIPPVQPYGQPVYPQQPYQQPTYGQPYPQGYRQQNYQQPYAGYAQSDDHPRDPLFRTYYQPGTQPYPQGRPLYTEEEQLARLDDLYARGVITYQDYQNQKADILDGF